MAVIINTSELKETLELTPSTQNVMLVGKHGIGKSEILTSYFNSKGMKVVTLFLGQMADPGDIIGIPSKVEKQDADGKATSRTDFTPPYWFPQDGEPIVLFLDELNRARPEILQTVMDLTLNRKLAGKALPEGSHVISAVNDGDEYQLTDLDPALVSRFNIYEFKPTVEEWLNWAVSQGLDERVINFIQDNPTWLDGDSSDYKGLEKSADRRAWKHVSDIMLKVKDIKDIHKRIIAGIVGAGAAAAFIRERRFWRSFLPRQIAVQARSVIFRFTADLLSPVIRLPSAGSRAEMRQPPCVSSPPAESREQTGYRLRSAPGGHLLSRARWFRGQYGSCP